MQNVIKQMRNLNFNIDPFQRSSAPLLGSHYPGEFSSNPNQTHLKQLIKLFRITWNYTCRCAEAGWKYTLQDSGSPGAGLKTSDLFIFEEKGKMFFFFLVIFVPGLFHSSEHCNNIC